MVVRVRFAPSPTGPLHIGGARTALFNFLFARKMKGDFILRFEDTDEARNKKEFVKDIKEGLSWLFLKWDEEYFQSKRLKIYHRLADSLLKQDLAYKDKGAVYFHVPAGKEIAFVDLIRGEISFKSRYLKDFPILKSSGTPTFHFANVVDDALMGITHVIRGEDHLSNTPLHLLLYQALNFKPPYFAHIPLILNPDRSKMSKRILPTAPTMPGCGQASSWRVGEVELKAYIKQGFLPEAMINFLVQLGWSDPKGREYFTLKELISAFDLNKVQKAGAIFDYQKLLHYNHYYMTEKTPGEYLRLVKPYLASRQLKDAEIKKLIPVMRERVKVASEIPRLLSFVKSPSLYSAALLVFHKSDRERTRKGLGVAWSLLAKLPQTRWRKEQLLKSLAKEAAMHDLQNGDLFWPIRVALTGEKHSPPPEEILAMLGRGESLKRISIAIKKLGGGKR